MRKRLFKEGIAVGCIFVGLLTIFFYDIFFLGKTLRVSNTAATALPSGQFNYPGGPPKHMVVHDNTPAVLEEPYQKFKKRSFFKGTFPLWNPHQGAGYPFLATMESSLFFLPEIILYVVPEPFNWDVYLLFRLFLAGVFTYCFMRVLRFGFLPSITAGIAYMFSGPILSWVPNVTLNADVLIPLFLLCIEMLLRRNSGILIIVLAFVFFQAVASGHPEHTLFLFLTGTLYLGFRIITKAYAYNLGDVVENFAIAFACGIGLSSILLFPSVEYVFFNSWHVHGRNVGLEAAQPEKAITILFPWYYAKALGVYRGWVVNTWAGGWIGFLPVWMSVFALFARNKRRIGYFFLLITSLYLLKVYGCSLVNWLGRLPVLSLIRFHLHITQNIAFGLSVLCGAAMSYLLEDSKNLRRFALCVLPIVFISVIALSAWPPQDNLLEVFALPAGILAIFSVIMVLNRTSLVNHRVVCWVIVLMLFSELFFLVPRERSTRGKAFQEPPYVTYLKADPLPFRVYGIGGCLYPNTATAFGLDDIGMYEGLFVKRFADYVRELVDGSFFNESSFHAFRQSLQDPSNAFLDLLNVKYLILPRNRVVKPWVADKHSLKMVYRDEVLIYERLNVLPRIMFRCRADVVSDDEQALSLLREDYDIHSRVLLARSPSEMPGVGNVPGEDLSRVDEIDLGINRKRFIVDMEREGFVILNDVNYPGWRVSVDGKARELLTANYLFQAVYVPSGRHEVEFAFRPMSFFVGLFISVLTLIFMLLRLFSDQRKRLLKR